MSGDLPGEIVWRYAPETIVLGEEGEWRKALPGLAQGDEVRIRAEATAPVYLVVATDSELRAHRWRQNEKLTDFRSWGRSLAPHRSYHEFGPWDVSRFKIDSGEMHFLAVGVTNLQPEVELDIVLVVRPGSLAIDAGGTSSVRAQPQLPSGELVQPLSPKWGGVWRDLLGIGWFLTGLLAMGAVMIANAIALLLLGARAVPELLAGDGTLALAYMTYRSVQAEAQRRALDAFRRREDRERRPGE